MTKRRFLSTTSAPARAQQDKAKRPSLLVRVRARMQHRLEKRMAADQEAKAQAIEAALIEAMEDAEFYLPHLCAVTGKAYAVLYKRRRYKAGPGAGELSSRYFSFKTIDLEGLGEDRGILTEKEKPESIGAIWIGHGLPCFHCQAKLVYPHIGCAKCQRLVCTGRSYKDDEGEFIFLCEEACGAG